MPPFFRQVRPSVPEPAPLSREVVDEAKILELDERIYGYRRAGNMLMADRCLDLRLAIRPPRPAGVPVIPGGGS